MNTDSVKEQDIKCLMSKIDLMAEKIEDLEKEQKKTKKVTDKLKKEAAKTKVILSSISMQPSKSVPESD